MFFHRRRSREQQLADLYEARIADLKEAYEARHAESLRVVKALAEQVEFLRAKHYGPAAAVSPSFVPATVKAKPEPDFMPGMAHSPFFLNEDEEDLHALKDGGFIDAVEHQQAIAQLRAATGGIPITVEDP
jgi:hypothetical protein